MSATVEQELTAMRISTEALRELEDDPAALGRALRYLNERFAQPVKRQDGISIRSTGGGLDMRETTR